MKRAVAMAMAVVATVVGIGWGQWARGGEEPVSGAEQYYQQTLRLFDQVQTDMPTITHKAEVAAKLYIEGNDLQGIAVEGEPPLLGEFQSRAGGLSTVIGWTLDQKGWKGLLFYFLRDGMAQADADRIKLYTDRGYPAFLFGTAEMLAAVHALNVQCVETVTIPAAPHNGLLQAADGTWIVPTYETGTLSTVWPFFGEFIGACTRMGRMPPVFISIFAPGGKERYEKLKNVKWLAVDPAAPAAAPQPVPAGQLGKEWLAVTRRWLVEMHDRQMPDIRRAAAQGAKALQDGHRVFGIMTGHSTANLPTVAHDAGYFKPIPHAWTVQHQTPDKVKEKFELQAGDFLYVDGYNSSQNEEGNYKIIDYARQQGAFCAFAFAGHNQAEVKAIRPGEVYIDTRWELGDVVVTVPGYDIKALPASGLLSTALYEMINAEMAGILAAKAPPAK